jgi:large subunit ribosomal protein L21
MYAVIATGGKQERVEIGSRINVEILDGDDGGTVELTPVLIVDGESVMTAKSALEGATVTGTIVGAAKGPKINGFIYKNKTNSSRRFGHRQHYSVVEVTNIAASGAPARKTAKATKA